MQDREELKAQIRKRALRWSYGCIFFAIVGALLLVWNTAIVLYGTPIVMNYVAVILCLISMRSWERGYHTWVNIFERNNY